jgi:uncharacterized membrane protein YraQ (UPF0718 family)
LIQFLTDFTLNTWDLAVEMAPYLLFGFAVAGILHVSIRKEFVQRWMDKPGLRSVVKASVLGVPMPLCSCFCHSGGSLTAKKWRFKGGDDFFS